MQTAAEPETAQLNTESSQVTSYFKLKKHVHFYSVGELAKASAHTQTHLFVICE